jgi:rhomboid protease GluP
MNADHPGRSLWWGHWALIALIVVCVVLELTLTLADWGWIGGRRWRGLAYTFGGFWPGLLQGWTPNYPLQPVSMFVTYGFFHSGLIHLSVNMITLWSMGRVVIARVGQGGFALLYLGSILGGAAGFALLASGVRPMVGASGALFGLVGGILAWNYLDRFAGEEALWPVLRAAGLLLVLNLVMWWAMDGQLAWETHLGGFVTGWLMAMLIDPRNRA